MPPRRRQAGNPLLENRLVLYRFVCREFGYDDLGEMLTKLRDVTAGIHSSDKSNYGQALSLNQTVRAKITRDRLAEYDANIEAHSRKLRMTGEHGRTWKPHQYLALLFSEHYLRRRFDDPEALRAALNRAKWEYGPTRRLPDYEPEDLSTVAFQSATGSGKTLLMHAHILQYRHYLSRAGRRLNNVVLVTPNEQMSKQHEREMRESGLRARLFSPEAGADLLAPVEIVDLNKLAEKKGVKRVAVADFGENNLVLVDEGHLGSSGKVWRERRKELSRGGFTFEYSATFNQVVGNRGDEDLLHAYGKCLLFDYAYRRFHADGYGKDYAISNLPQGSEDENSGAYLLGCLLTFYQQCRIWREKGALWQDFNPAKPLWVFLGKTVTGSSKADRETRSDVARILNFIGWVLARGDAARPLIARLLAGESGLLDENGRDYFAERFRHLPRDGEDLYADLCETLFHGAGRLRVVYLTAGEGELHLRSGDNPPFGVVNVGDSAKLYALLAENANPDFDVEREMGFAERLFHGVDRPDSPVNVVIGARRFIAGWNSWRVSVMGLMHVGRGEGPEIIQMFGRGVRLKGWKMSLKRHLASGAAPPAQHGGQLAELEKLHIFGLRADYMQRFREMLREGGMGGERKTFRLPVTWNFARDSGLKTLRLKEGRCYDFSAERPVLPEPDRNAAPAVTLDLYSRLEAVASGGGSSGQETQKNRVSLKPYAAFFDTARVYDRLLRRKRQKGWRNLAVERRTVERLLQGDDWYELYLPAERLRSGGFQRVRELEDIAGDLIDAYADRFWRKERRRWEHNEIEVAALDENDPNNPGAYELSVDADAEQLIADIHKLKRSIKEGDQKTCPRLGIGVMQYRSHAYRPLLHVHDNSVVTVQPVLLDRHERKVVMDLEGLAHFDDSSLLQDRELFLIRNLTRGRGVSFFDDFGYYPDFIVWLKDGDLQHMLFLDPKGLSRFGRSKEQKVKLHEEIKEVEARVREAEPNLRLHAYVLSVTPPGEIGGGRQSQGAWERQGVYYLDGSDRGVRRIIEDVLRPPV